MGRTWAFADLVAIFQHFSYDQVLEAAIRTSRGKLEESKLLTGIAQQFGDTTGICKALRSAIDDLDETGTPRFVSYREAVEGRFRVGVDATEARELGGLRLKRAVGANV